MQSIESLSDEQIENSNIHVIPISRDSSDKDMSYEKGDANQRYKTLLDRKSRLVEYQDGISINMTVHGQTTMTVGDMVNVSLPAVGSEDEALAFIVNVPDSTVVAGFVDLTLNLYSPAAVPEGITPFISGV